MHDIYIYEEGKSKTSGIRIPWLPDEISINFGDLRAGEYEILDSGPVDIPVGSNLGEISFSSTFPGKNRGNLPFLRGSLQEPKTYINLLNRWKTEGTKLKVIITGTVVNHNVFCQKFAFKHVGGYGDVQYELTLKTRREVKITTVKTSSASKNKTKATSATNTTKTHKIKKGDTLWGIAEKYLGKGSRYREIYNLNKSVIEETAKKYGKKSSDGGHWIYPGVSLKIPNK